MANVGSAASGKTLIGAGVGASPTYASIGTNSGLGNHGVLLAQNNSPFIVALPGVTGTVLMSNGTTSDPSFQSGGSIFGQTITGDSGGALSPTAGNWNIFGSGSITTSGSGSTLTAQLTGLTNHSVLVGAGTTTITKVAPASAGTVLMSNGVSSDPSFQSGGTFFGQTITGNTGGALSPTAGNWNILGNNNAQNGFAAYNTGSGSTLTTNSYSPAKWYVNATSGVGTHTTISTAITSAASGDTIFITPGTYTENLTLKAGVNLTAWQTDSNNGTVIIIGKCTMTTAGTVNISGIQLKTNSDFFLAVTGNAASIVNLFNCYLNASNNTGISYTSSSGSSQIILTNCMGDLGTTGIALFASSGSGTLGISNSSFSNSGGAVTASTCSAGALIISKSGIASPITTSGTSATTFEYINIDTNAINTTALTVGGSNPTQLARFSRFASGSASAVSIGSALTMDHCEVNSTNTNAITGAGTLNLGTIDFTGSSSTINTSTVASLSTKMGSLSLNTALTVANGGTGRATLTNHGLLVGAGTTAVTQLSVAATGTVMTGVTGADPAFSATPTVTSITFGSGTALSDYQEGTWTPTIIGSTTPGTASYSTQSGRYTKIGRMVFLDFNVVGTSGGTAAGNIYIGGLPFTINVSNTSIGTLSSGNNNLTFGAGYTWGSIFPVSNTTTMGVLENGSGKTQSFIAIVAATAYAFQGSFSYSI